MMLPKPHRKKHILPYRPSSPVINSLQTVHIRGKRAPKTPAPYLEDQNVEDKRHLCHFLITVIPLVEGRGWVPLERAQEREGKIIIRHDPILYRIDWKKIVLNSFLIVVESVIDSSNHHGLVHIHVPPSE